MENRRAGCISPPVHLSGTVMKRFAMLAFAALLAIPAVAFGKTFPIPSDDAIATVSIPDSWKPSPYDGGVEATAADGGVYVAVEMVKANDLESATKNGIEWFGKQGVEIDPDSMKTEDVNIGSLPGFELSFSGKDKDGPAEVSMTLVPTNASGKFLFVYYWGSPAGAKANLNDLKAIANSLQATK